MSRKQTAADDAPLDALCERYWPAALGLALDSAGMPARCSRRTCRTSGGCRVTVLPDRPPRCGGGDIPMDAIEKAAFATLFAVMVSGEVG